MYKLSRLMLTLAIVLTAYWLAIAIFLAIQENVPPDKQGMVWAILIVVAMVTLARKKGRRLLTAFGTAAWASSAELERASMIGATNGLILGRIPTEGIPIGGAVKALLNWRLYAPDACREFFWNLRVRKRKQGRLVRLPQAVHTSVFCPTGGGKGVSLLVPFLLTCNESCVVADGKDGELARLTAKARRRMGQQVILLDPDRVVTARPDTLNLLDFIDEKSPRAVNEAAGIANALVVRTGEEKHPHFLDRAEHWFTALIGLALCFGQREQGTRSLVRVAEIASNPQSLKSALALMQQHPEGWGGSLARMGGMLAHSMGEELASTLATVGRFLSFINAPSVAENLRASNFDLSKLRKKPMTIYLIQRASDTRSGSALLRLWLNGCIREVMKGGLGQKQKVHCLIDEAGSIGRMECLKDVLNVGRGFGLRMQLYYQDTGQLKTCWENPQGVLANTTKIFFSTQAYETAEIISKSIGTGTIIVESGGSNSGWSRNRSSSSGQGHSESSGSSYSQGSNSNWQQQGRELLKPDEILALDPRIAITLTPGVRPLWTKLIRYYEETALLKHRGLLRRMAAACWTVVMSAVLLILAAAAAKSFTSELHDYLEQQQQQQQQHIAPAIGQPAPWLTPGKGRR
jgi:type IV secretion system protein VirD4